MKKLLTFMLCICAASISYAQLKVYSNGKVGIARDTTTTARAFLTIGNGTESGEYKTSIYSDLPIQRGYYNISIDAKAFSSIPDDTYNGYERSIGVRGIAGNSPDGLNFGIMGSLMGDRMGAGVYGAVDIYKGNMVDGYYAGYFDGPTKVNDDFIVTGYTETLLLDSESGTNSIQRLSGTNSETTVSDKLVGLNAIPYYKIQPTKQKTVQSDSSFTHRTNLIIDQRYDKKHYALSASQLEEIYPDLVYEKGDGSKMINYVGMIPLLVQSISELKAEIAELKGSNAKTRSYNSATGIDGLETIDVASLSQNSPNPFTTATNIEMLIPSEASTALFCIYDMSGKQVKQNVIHERGKTTLNVTSEGLSAGMYLYSLIIDGKVIDTRRMILTK